ncbi:tetratricopeptide repeat domain-containing protein [Hirsutella rhossiliensis]|uniref:Tetratricopeptide repeat domain-containing protein n=1 Tax=Hirsutella rhossiliensis TaxID=111463 RepID=A0A9P8N7H9_9HYPO|nr:tetratricopeptide repeat domain-containing protein [Hirsutella rhossiliensis]KAH0966042.1 tetratricopeptide repeat domain-containing protein [Hirsutella rhossiliensis]
MLSPVFEPHRAQGQHQDCALNVYKGDQRGSLAQRLIAEGSYLLEALWDHCRNGQHGKTPLVFICHGTGGLVLKAALCVCRDHPFQFRPVIDIIAGVIFLGVPHFVGGKKDARKTFDLLLKCQHKGIGRDLSSNSDIEELMERRGSVQDAVQPGRDNESDLRSFAICGLGGIGKTQLAVEYAYSRRDKFEAIFWLSADEPDILAKHFAYITEALGLDDELSDLAACRDVAMGWLSEPLRKRSEPESPENTVNWLIIFDNLDNLDVVADYWPKFGRGSVLVTSRDYFAKHTMHVEHGRDLMPLSNDDSEKEALATIATKSDGLPLAISQLSGIFRHLRLSSYAAFLKYLNEEGIQGIFEKHSEPTDSHRISTLATVWALDKLSSGTRALLQVISLLDPDDILEEQLIDKANVRNRAAATASLADKTSALQIAGDTDLEKISLHRLIQVTSRGMMSKEELVAAFQAVTNLIIVSWPMQDMKEHHSIARLDKCENIFPSVLRLKIGLEALIKDSIDFPLNIRAARLFNDTGWYMFERGLMEESKPFCELGLLIGERLQDQLGEVAVESIRESHGFLGIILTETNEHSRSMWHKKKWLTMLVERRSASGGHVEDYELGYAYNEIGVAYGNNDMLEDAADAFKRSIEIFQSIEDYEDTWLGWPEPNLGFIYWMQGKLEDAEEALVEILDIHAAAWGVDDIKSFKTGKILYGMGNVLESQGRLEESFSFHRRCLEQFRKVLGGQYKEAEDYLNSALKIFNSRSYLTNERARTSFRKSKLLRLMGKRTAANRLSLEAYETRKQLRPLDGRPLEELEEADFDELVAFWSR